MCFETIMDELGHRSVWSITRRPFAYGRPVVGSVMLICPGGLEHGSAIGRQMGYFLQAHRPIGIGLNYRVVDSRGPWFLGASPICIGLAICYFIGAAFEFLKAHVSFKQCLIHANITGRGSTLRKVILLAFARSIGLHSSCPRLQLR
jgi:hypothetical protein